MLLIFSSARHSPTSFLLLILLTKQEAQNRNLPAVILELKPKVMGRQWNWKVTLTLQPKREFWLQERLKLKERNKKNSKFHIVSDFYFGTFLIRQNTNSLWQQFAVTFSFPLFMSCNWLQVFLLPTLQSYRKLKNLTICCYWTLNKFWI
jgi:hypothetical protein